MTPLESSVATQNGGRFLTLPLTLGAIAVVYNLPQIGGHTLQLDGPTLARIFMGEITTWNDPAIAKLNPSTGLPSAKIVTVHRLDRGGNAYILSEYLSKVSPAWATAMGTGQQLAWPVGMAVTGTAGMDAAIASTANCIGFTDIVNAVTNNFTYAAIRNQTGRFLQPDQASITAAAAEVADVTATSPSITNAPGRASYPIAGYTWAVLRQHHARAAQGAALANLFRYMTGAGQQLLLAEHNAPLPASMQAEDSAALATVR
jgi:phosphate transport system substrate-binding protein